MLIKSFHFFPFIGEENLVIILYSDMNFFSTLWKEAVLY